MQNKKSLLKRLLVIYISFFIILITSIVHSVIPQFTKGSDIGTELGEDITESWLSGAPKLIYLLPNIPVTTEDELTTGNIAQDESISIKAHINTISLVVEENKTDKSITSIAFSVAGGSPFIYLFSISTAISYITMIVFMFIIINSIRKAIKNSVGLSKKNVWYMRVIGFLTIYSTLCDDVMIYMMNNKAAQLLANSDLMVNANFTVSYDIIILGVIIIFTAEVFAIGYNLSEEQKLTI